MVLKLFDVFNIHYQKHFNEALKHVDISYGRGVYTSDELVACGVNLQNNNIHNDTTTNINTCNTQSATTPASTAATTNTENNQQQRTTAVVTYPITTAVENNQQQQQRTTTTSSTVFLPPSTARIAGIYPIIYASTTCMYPNAQEYAWRVSNTPVILYYTIVIL